jgi:hypothetical protein
MTDYYINSVARIQSLEMQNLPVNRIMMAHAVTFRYHLNGNDINVAGVITHYNGESFRISGYTYYVRNLRSRMYDYYTGDVVLLA